MQIFFPISASQYYYLICLNLRTKLWEVIDNDRQGKAANGIYLVDLCRLVSFTKSLTTFWYKYCIYHKLDILKMEKFRKKHFIKYLKEKDLGWFASSINRMITTLVKMAWQTLQNNTDCAVFLMRHMKTYKGDTKNWNT